MSPQRGSTVPRNVLPPQQGIPLGVSVACFLRSRHPEGAGGRERQTPVQRHRGGVEGKRKGKGPTSSEGFQDGRHCHHMQSVCPVSPCCRSRSASQSCFPVLLPRRCPLLTPPRHGIPTASLGTSISPFKAPRAPSPSGRRPASAAGPRGPSSLAESESCVSPIVRV